MLMSLAISLISIHALREEGDLFTPAKPPAIAISIHALREEGDTNVGAVIVRNG